MRDKFHFLYLQNHQKIIRIRIFDTSCQIVKIEHLSSHAAADVIRQTPNGEFYDLSHLRIDVIR